MKKIALLALIILGTVIGLAGTDLVLPAVPALPEALAGTPAQAQLVLATFVAGTATGLLLFGEAGARFSHRYLLVFALSGYAVTSLVASTAVSLTQLIAIRAVQGFFAAAPAVFAPAMIKAMFSEQKALRAIGAMSSIESLAPALAPVAGAALLLYFDWRASFIVLAVLAATLALLWLLAGGALPPSKRAAPGGNYARLLVNRRFLQHALSQACTLGGLLIWVFGAPAVIVNSLAGTLSDFVIMQIIGITFFILAANLADRLVARFGSTAVIRFGSALSTAGFAAITLYTLGGGSTIPVFWLLFLFANLGLGLRGPPGFYQALVAAGDDDARGSALLILFILGTTALGTTLTAPLVERGAMPLAAAATAVSALAVLLLWRLPRTP